MSKKILITADHGMAIIYFLQSDVVPALLEAGVIKKILLSLYNRIFNWYHS